ncbi:hypothetical protein [Salininema proteolyticum]|uniref:Uncharacterized protein n=1 Tax=Salininema proteolyticum TaxID=1607685 RepID=A0ABV8TW31_9ACTN
MPTGFRFLLHTLQSLSLLAALFFAFVYFDVEFAMTGTSWAAPARMAPLAFIGFAVLSVALAPRQWSIDPAPHVAQAPSLAQPAAPAGSSQPAPASPPSAYGNPQQPGAPTAGRPSAGQPSAGTPPRFPSSQQFPNG